MAYYYILNTGSSTTAGGTTKQTGAFSGLAATAVYASISSAITYGATSGDYICVSDAHSYTGSLVYTGPASGAYLNIVSVDDANCDQYAIAASAQEVPSAGGDTSINNRISLNGIYISAYDDLKIGGGHTVRTENCTIEVEGTNDKLLSLVTDAAGIFCINCTFIAPVSATVNITNGSSVEVYGGSISGGILSLITSSFQAGGGRAKFIGVDMSTLSGTLVNGAGGAEADNGFTVSFEGCRVNSGVTFNNESLASLNQRVTAANCGSTGDEGEYQYHAEGFGGAVDDIDTIYRDGSTAFPGGSKTSLKCVTLSTADPSAPFWFDFPTRYAELSNTATDTLRIYLYSVSTLYDSDVWAEALYQDGTTKPIYNFLSSRHGEPLDTNGTELDTNTESWTGDAGTENYYQIDLDTFTNDPGADCVPIIRLYVAKASATIYFCTSVDLV